MHKKADHCVHLHAFVTDLLLIAPMMLGFHYYSLLKHILVFNFFFFFLYMPYLILTTHFLIEMRIKEDFCNPAQGTNAIQFFLSQIDVELNQYLYLISNKI